jgi:hypothetical protein
MRLYYAQNKINVNVKPSQIIVEVIIIIKIIMVKSEESMMQS